VKSPINRVEAFFQVVAALIGAAFVFAGAYFSFESPIIANLLVFFVWVLGVATIIASLAGAKFPWITLPTMAIRTVVTVSLVLFLAGLGQLLTAGVSLAAYFFYVSQYRGQRAALRVMNEVASAVEATLRAAFEQMCKDEARKEEQAKAESEARAASKTPFNPGKADPLFIVPADPLAKPS
jgi:hypothetical protein